MFLRESWVIGEVKSKNPKLDYGVAPMPGWKRNDTLSQPWAVYMSDQGAKTKAVRDLLKFITSEKAATKLIELSGWIPERKFNSEALLKETPQYQIFVTPPRTKAIMPIR